ncbi:hypothetical protein [Aquimarina longa]|uniref:hypothetical protein n=1 Tax=Aquimarina longa TaxID=1080221 RepID=UPI0007850607|nr:hypothetical protein [Aquimarina longa]
MKSTTIKYYLISLFSILNFSVKAQQLDVKTKTEIQEFVKKETKYLHALKFKKYYKNFNDADDFVIMFKGEKINRKRVLKKSKRKLKKKKGEYSKLERTIMTPFKEFYNDFDLYILTKEDIEQDSKKTTLNKLFGMDITKNWNPKIEFTKNRYLVCLLPKVDFSKSKITSKYGEFMILQILEKNKRKWKVYSSWN